jgi:hypothetical protein
LIIDTYYLEPLRLVYQSRPGLEHRPYAEQLQAIYDLGFARADFLPRNLRQLGHEAEQIIANAVPLQWQWAEEHGLRLPPVPFRHLFSGFRRVSQRMVRGLRRRLGFSSVQAHDSWKARIVATQVEAINPDIIFNCDLLHFPPGFLWQIKGEKRKLIGESAYPIPPHMDLRPYDLLVSCVPHYVERFRRAGAHAGLLRHGFDPSILRRLEPMPRPEGVVFIGALGGNHRRRIELLEAVSRRVPLRCWGAGAKSLPPESPLRGCIQPPLWGYDMYRELQHAQMALNIHVDVAENSAGNMRLFEATGVGTLLITDWKENLHEMFEPGKEVVAYRSPEECVELIQYYLEHDDEREAIARAGQQRTLREHTYYHRMQELTDLVTRYL